VDRCCLVVAEQARIARQKGVGNEIGIVMEMGEAVAQLYLEC